MEKIKLKNKQEVPDKKEKKEKRKPGVMTRSGIKHEDME